MHYRHLFHAGNFADVFKHTIVVALLRALSIKAKPWYCLETHAGAGLYELTDPQAERTGEWREGIDRLWQRAARAPALVDYLELVRAANPHGALRVYPGSPWLAHRLARAGDRVVACEAVPEVAAALALTVPGVELHRRDGYQAAALLPPPQRRGLILVDPPFERGDEFDAAAAFLREARRRFPGGVYAVWYPLKNRHTAARFERQAGAGAEGLALGLDVGAHAPGRLHACGLLVINPPFGFAEAVEPALRELSWLLSRGRGAGCVIRPFRGDDRR